MYRVLEISNRMNCAQNIYYEIIINQQKTKYSMSLYWVKKKYRHEDDYLFLWEFGNDITCEILFSRLKDKWY